MRQIPANRTWLNWKTHWTHTFQEKRELVKLTSITRDGMANQAAKSEMGNTMVTALDNLANAAVIIYKAHRPIQHGLSRIMTTAKTTAGTILYAGTGTVPREVVPDW